MKLSLKTRLLAVALLGLVSCAVSIFGLGRILSQTNAVRVERARDAVTTELALLRSEAGNPSWQKTARISLLGMRGGYVADVDCFETRTDVDETTRRALHEVGQRAAESGAVAMLEGEGSDPIVVYGAAPTDKGSLAWIAYTVRPSQFITMWRVVLLTLTATTVLLLATAISTLLAVRRGVSTLNASLAALAGDLTAPVPRPGMPELASLADHIDSMARALENSQSEKERLGTELAQRDRLAALGRVVAGVAHEVRNPLASIKLRVDVGRMRPGTPAQLAGELASVSDEITRLDRLVADLLVVAGRRKGPRAMTPLGELVDRRAALLAQWAGERKVRIEVKGDASAALDGDAVARAVDNLIRNAVEASPEGTAVEVEVLDGEGTARVRVMDHGPGVDDARLPELFEPFFTTKPEGTGLGLALSRAIAATHGGTLTYERRAGATCFELSFPRKGSAGNPAQLEAVA